MTEPFSIACTTCQARLKVRDPSAIGQILPCPKCGSMVLIEPPAGETADDLRMPVRPTAAPAARTPQTVPGVPHESIQLPQRPADEAEKNERPLFEEAADLTDESGEDEQPPPHPLEHELDDELQDWLASPSQRLRQIVLVCVAGCVGMGLAVLVFVIFVRQAERPADGQAQATVTKDETTQENSSASTPDNEPASTASETSEEPVEPTEAGMPEGAAPSLTPDSSETPDTETPAAPERPPLSNERNATPTEGPTSPSDPGSPPDLKPVSPSTSPAKQAFGGRFPQGFDKFERLIGVAPTVEPAAPPATNPANPAPANPTPAAGVAASRPPLPAIDVAARLADPVAGIEFSQTPLVEAVRFVSQLSTIPITWAIDDVPDKRGSLSTPVSFRLESTTVAGVLDACLKSKELRYSERDGQIIVHASPSLDEATRQELSLAEILSNDDATRKIATGLIQDCIQPGAWEGRGGTAKLSLEGETLTIEAPPSIVRQVLAFCQRWQATRRSPVAGATQVDELGLSGPHWSQPFTVSAIRPTPLPRLIDRVEKAVPVRVLVDWRSLASVNWGLETPLTFTSDQRPLRETLDSMLTPQGLGFRVVDRDVLEITTSDRLAARPEFVFYSVGDLILDKRPEEQLLTDIRRGLGINAEAPGLVIRYDRLSRHVIASLPAPMQIRLAAILEGMRAAS